MPRKEEKIPFKSGQKVIKVHQKVTFQEDSLKHALSFLEIKFHSQPYILIEILKIYKQHKSNRKKGVQPPGKKLKIYKKKRIFYCKKGSENKINL